MNFVVIKIKSSQNPGDREILKKSRTNISIFPFSEIWSEIFEIFKIFWFFSDFYDCIIVHFTCTPNLSFIFLSHFCWALYKQRKRIYIPYENNFCIEINIYWQQITSHFLPLFHNISGVVTASHKIFCKHFLNTNKFNFQNKHNSQFIIC